jgi:hypothetical protein
MPQSFRGLPLPPDWTIAPDHVSGDLMVATGKSLPQRMTYIEVCRRIERFWNLKPETLNEQHRKPDQAPRDTATAQSAAGDARREAQRVLTVPPRKVTLADYAAQTIAAGTGGIIPFSPPNPMSDELYRQLIRQKSSIMRQAMRHGAGWDLGREEVKPKPLPREAPIVGELIGHRIWKVEGGNLLRSYSSGSAWFPGQPMHDKISKGQEIDDHNQSGVWAFKNPYDLAGEFLGEIRNGAVVGTCWLWGTVIEHERGYRAQFASIRSLEHAGKDTNLEVLRAAYLPAKPQS